jgi:Ca2+-binding RTX toxin-like protein
VSRPSTGVVVEGRHRESGVAFLSSIDLGDLDGTTGFRLNGAAVSDASGNSVASAGDVNGDGYDDLIVGAVGADPNGSSSGASYVVFGTASGFAASVDLSTLDGTTGFRLDGVASLDQSGFSVASAGDVNGDGYDDLIVGATEADPNGSNSGASYVVFGKASGFAASLDLSALDGTTGFRLNGVAASDSSGWSVASAGDVNGDGYDDLIVGAHQADPNGTSSGASYVVFGKASGFAAGLDLSTLDGTTGFRLNGVAANDQSGISVASAGDVNGDGYDDLIVGAPGVDPNGSNSGTSYVVFGKGSGFAASLDLSSLDGTTGFRLNGVAAGDQSGRSVASAGDVNGDGYDDLIVGAFQADPNGTSSGASYLVFGKASGFAASLDLSTLDGTTGFRLNGVEAYDASGFSVASAGDVNGDGYDDLIVGALSADSNGLTNSGATYVVFGKGSGFAASLELSTLDGTTGFRLNGVAASDQSGASVASAGDVNGDGYEDLMVGARGADTNGNDSGASYVVFGGAFGDPDTPVTTTGTAAAEMFIGGIGADVLTGGGGADLFRAGAGDDRLVVSDVTFRLADGGSGTDTLALDGSGLVLDLSTALAAGRLEGIERIDLSGSGNNILKIGAAAVLGGVGAVTGGKHVLTVLGNSGDAVQSAESGWTKTGSFEEGGVQFDRWELGNAIIDIQQGVGARGLAFPSSIELGSLDGTTGFRLSGAAALDLSGYSVASAGDVNGDGYDDVIVGAPRADPNGSNSGASYVVFGKGSGFAASVDLSTLDGTTGFRLNSAAASDQSGHSAASAGDVNGDGYDDLIVGARYADPNGSNSGASYVVFGKASGFAASLELSTLDGTTGFRLNGVAAADQSGFSVSSAGDVNGDGYDDLIVGATLADPNGSNSGASYVVFGKASGFAASLNLSTLDGTNGFRLNGAAASDQSGRSVSSAGDVNGDGYDDLIVGAWQADPNGNNSGASYVVFGKASGFAASLNLSSLDGTTGFRLNGVAVGDASGVSVASAGDVNGDGYDDLIVGAQFADPNGANSGASYVVFGKASGFAASVDLSTLDGTTGFRLNGVAASDTSGRSVASAGDLNGDGYDDLIVGANGADPNGLSSAGASYLVFGKASGFAASFDLSTLDGTTGFVLNGAAASDYSGSSVASAGDVNGDGYDDLIVGARGAETNGYDSGASYVVFGGAFGDSTVPVTTTGTAAAEMFIGGRGEDVLTGGGGADLFRAGAGDDRLVVSDVAFRLADGGSGTDTLTLDGSGLVLDLSTALAAARLEGIERIELTGSGNNIVKIGAAAVLGGIGAVTGGKHVLTVLGNTGDKVQFAEAGWAKTGSFEEGGVPFGRWELGNAIIDIQQGVGAGGALTGGPGADVLNGTDGDDVLDGGTGADTLTGGLGDDTYYVDDAGDAVIEAAGQGTDTIYTYLSNHGLGDYVERLGFAGSGDFTGTGNGLANRLYGGAGDDTLDGGAGNDRLYGGAGADIMIGGLGDDRYYFYDVGDQVLEAAGQGIDKVDTTLSAFLLADNVERVQFLGGGSFFGTGNGLGNWLIGNTGDDMLDGGAGDDRLYGGAGADELTGGTGDDRYYVDNVGDEVIEAAGQGIDTVYTSLSTFVLGDNVERLAFTGSGDFTGTGNGLGNRLYGGAGDDTLDGGAGNDRLYGGAGADEMTGGLGDDRFYVDTVGDEVIEAAGQGIDEVYTSLSTYVLDDNVERLVFTGTGDFTGTGNGLGNRLYGGAGDDTLDGGAGGDRLYGGAGADEMTGGLGNDTYYVDNVGDQVIEAAGQGLDTVFTSLSTYVLGEAVERLGFTGSGNFTGTGNGLANTIVGGAGDDELIGGLGADTLKGGGGTDTFVYREAAESTRTSRDTIVDFTVGTDSIDFTEMNTGGGFHALQTVTSLPATIDAQSLVAYVAGGNTVLYVNDTGAAQTTSNASMQILLTGVTTLGDADLDYFLV